MTAKGLNRAQRNCDAWVAAYKDRRPDGELGRIERQNRYVARQLSRCRRCGDHFAMLGHPNAMLAICGPCEKHLRQLAGEGSAKWFADLVHEHLKS